MYYDDLSCAKHDPFVERASFQLNPATIYIQDKRQMAQRSKVQTVGSSAMMTFGTRNSSSLSLPSGLSGGQGLTKKCRKKEKYFQGRVSCHCHDLTELTRFFRPHTDE